MFIGSGFTGTEITTSKVYYIATVSGYNITIKESRESVTIVPLATVAGITNAKAYMQNETLFVSKNGTLVQDNNYAVVSNTLVYTDSLNAGDILNVNGHEITLMQTLTPEGNPQTGAQFGISVNNNTYASEVLVGAPFQLSTQTSEGVVYRYTEPGASYGMYIGAENCNVAAPRTILINGFLIFIPAGNATVVANAINSSNITNVAATAINGKLVILLVDNSLAPINEKLCLSITDTTTLSELGITVFDMTQEIVCPHNIGPTQFGTVVKFNEYGSFVASAPVGTRYSATTFDFVDDENQDNDTLFDNNTTSWIDESPNFGSVYMFDYISQYNESLLNLGKFVYAQSVNSPNLAYTPFNTYDQATDVTTSNQPLYGTALDFNNYGVIVGTPGDVGSTTGSEYAGSATVYNNSTGVKDWSLHRYSAPIVDINKIFNIQLFSAESNETLINMDYIDPLQGKILGAARENIDIISNVDPANYNNGDTVTGGLVWGADHVGKVWLNTKNLRFVNYHQNNDVSYNSQYWGTLFPGSDVSVCSWVASNVLPGEYRGPGIPVDVTS
jgi:hypothetical protein